MMKKGLWLIIPVAVVSAGAWVQISRHDARPERIIPLTNEPLREQDVNRTTSPSNHVAPTASSVLSELMDGKEPGMLFHAPNQPRRIISDASVDELIRQPSPLTIQQIQLLYQWLADTNSRSGEFCCGSEHVLESSTMNYLSTWNPVPSHWPEVLTAMSLDEALPAITQDYAIQHLSVCFLHIADEAQQKKLVEALWQNAERGRRKGTALIGLKRLHESGYSLPEGRLLADCLSVVNNERKTGQSVTALKILNQLNPEQANREAIRALNSAHDANTLLKMAAIHIMAESRSKENFQMLQEAAGKESNPYVLKMLNKTIEKTKENSMTGEKI